MTPFQHYRKALGWREELLSYEECDVFGHVDDRGEDGADVYDLVRVVSLCGVQIVVPIDASDLDRWEREHVFERAMDLVVDRRDYIGPPEKEYDPDDF